MSKVYSVNKAINRPIVFKGLKAQYIWWLGIGLALILLVFTLLYIAGVPVLFCVLLVFVSGASLFKWVYVSSKRYGENGMMKNMAAKNIPRVIKCDQLVQ
jgi:hypothetical protein